MAFTSPNMALTVWNLLSDLFDHSALAANFSAIDAHDHTAGKGVQLASGAFADGSVTTNKLATGAVTAAKITNNTITATQIANVTITAAQIANATITATQLASGVLTTALSSSPPGSPVDGQIWMYPADALGTVWQFRYNAGSGSASKWECVGGSDLQITSGTMTLARAGDYSMSICALAAQSVSTGTPTGNVYAAVGGTPTAAIAFWEGNNTSGAGSTQNVNATLSCESRVNTVAASAAVTIGSATSGGISFSNTILRVRPVRVA